MSYTIPSVMIALVLMSMVLVGTSIFMAGVVGEYGVTNTTDISTVSQLYEIESLTNDMSQTTQNTTRNVETIDYTGGVTKGIWGSLMLIFKSGTFATTMTNRAIESSGVEIGTWFRDGLMIIFTLIIFAALVSLATRNPTL